MTDTPAVVAQQLAQALEDSWNAHDMTAFAAIFHDDASFVNRYGMLWLGRDAVYEGHRFIHEGVYRDTTVANEAAHVEEIAPGVVVVHMLSRMAIGPSMPHGPRALNTLMLFVATERDGAWKIRTAENVMITDPMSDQPVLDWPHPLSPLPA
ncbi:MAG: SgcJ/EcaC family oxidoreductase [Sphingomonas sp.]|uniref:SgcJ/EcaC family oxidoreductase n=1 Tax=Sphingomonas sp. TaxID=28214 RepID=UPI001ACF422A|nr:SgcJ/EcaC family oxidoreductase [Sphingomonas sp.]MBN8816960.1 SgcJ/EcaC family oxidoreductase [Sphingomonas sp.]